MQIVSVIHQASQLGVRVRVNPETYDIKIVGQKTPETAEVLAELTSRKPEVLIAFNQWQRLRHLLIKPCLWAEESRELLHLAKCFGVRVEIQRVALGSIYSTNFGRIVKINHIAD